VNDTAAVAPDRDTFVKQFSPDAPRAWPLRELHALLVTADPKAALPARLLWLEKLARWTRGGALPGKAARAAAGAEAPRSQPCTCSRARSSSAPVTPASTTSPRATASTSRCWPRPLAAAR
jgi:hypothetical protein